jgi:predicted thioesterase
MLEVGIKGSASVLVTEENSAKTMGSGTLDVFATPAMIALMERTCWTSVANKLDEGWGSVGTALDVAHSAPTPLGVTVTCESELIAVEGRKLTFQVVAHDPSGEIGRGTHQRFLVDNAKFQKKADSKKG